MSEGVPSLSASTLVSLLSGGLGNQLFQFAAALSLNGLKPVSLVYGRELTRTSSSGKPILADYCMPDYVEFRSLRSGFRGFPTSALLGRALAVSATGSTLSEPMEMALRLILAGKSAASSCLCISNGVSHGTDRVDPNCTICLGYFQSYRLVELAGQRLDWSSFRVRNSSPWLDEHRELAVLEKPITLHIRRGDYKGLSQYGLLSYSYYRSAVERLRDEGLKGSIWISSDESVDPEAVIGVKADRKQVRVLMPPRGVSDAHVQEAMSYSAAVVTANSTFSWWAAWFASLRGAQVILPTPWTLDPQIAPDVYVSGWLQQPAIHSH